jgi:hypothetical protein
MAKSKTIKLRVIEKEIKRPGKIQCILVLLNLLIFIVGAAMLFIGFATQNKKMFEKLMKWVTKKGLPKPLQNIVKKAVQKSGWIAGYLMFSGFAISVVSFLGCCGAWCSRKLLKYYMCAMCVIILIIGGAGFVANKEAGNAVPFIAEGLSKIFVHYDKSEARKAILIIQSKGRCCGGLGPQDWGQDEIFYTKFNNYIKANATHDITGDLPVPDSCCTRPESGCGLRNNETHADAFDAVKEILWNDDNEFLKYKEKYEKDSEGTWEEHNAEEPGFEEYDYYYNENGGCNPDDTVCQEHYDYYNNMYDENGNVKWDDWEEKEHDPEYIYEDEFNYAARRGDSARFLGVSSNLINPDGIFGRFTDSEKVQSGEAPEGQHIYKYGCAVKYGNMIRKSRFEIKFAFFCMAFPSIVCLYMASRVNKYFKEMEDSESE